MKTEKARELCDFMEGAIGFFQYIFEGGSYPSDIQKGKTAYTKERFKEKYENFYSELVENIREYQDVDVIYDYLIDSFEYLVEWDGFDDDLNREIMQSGNDVSYLLKLKLLINEYNDLLYDFYETGNSTTDMVDKTFDQVMDSLEAEREEQSGLVPPMDKRFDFDQMIAECREQGLDTLAQIHLINDRLFDLKQWQLKFDKLKTTKLSSGKMKSEYVYSPVYYPNFIQLCALERERLEMRLELEKKALTHKAIENNPVIIQGGDSTPYNWNVSATDLLELVAALYKSDSLKRKDGRPLTRKELIDYFQQIFNMEIKDAEGKLNKATSRKKNMTPYLDGLKTAFESYVEEKEEKLAGRK
ncbi:RteC domain-containing protein [Parabacteroides sp. FAFU027]|uniref:RteC domain-containing protein n=1 Tax=Parabacteroides sp. FAFU027 TaxID=2922715 RepID=UPI001FAF37C5|nr:RteC domain-containing protein [Parabacteroides sp. FAFU027]